ncbi:MAG: zf-HC2 domain-containing protein [Clostridia bacterium]|nr:zf-HC2 domain-containing protein [Clostridia bacterium]
MSEMKNQANLSCAVVRDLMPLYVEELTGEETNQQIAGHIASCPVCAQALGMQQARIEIEKNGKKRDANGIRFLKKQAVKRIALVLAIVVLLIFGYYVVDSVLFWQQTIHENDIYSAGCYQLSDGRIVVAFGVEGLSPAQVLNGSRWMDMHTVSYAALNLEGDYQCSRNITLYTNNYNRWFGKADERGEIFYYVFDPENAINAGEISITAFRPVASKENSENAYYLSEIFVNGYELWLASDEAKTLTAEEEKVLLEAVEKSTAGARRVAVDALSTLMQ